MAWTTFSSFVTDQIVSPTDINNIVGNLNYLFQRPKQKITFDNGANYTRAANTFAAIDSTNLSITLSVQSGTVLVSFVGTVSNAGPGQTDFDFTVDGTRYGTGFTDGIATSKAALGAADETVSFAVLVTGLSVGSHTFIMQWKAQTSTATLYAGAGSAGTDYAVMFGAVEIA